MSDDNFNRAGAHAAIAMRHDDLKRVYFASAVCFDRIYIHGGCQEAAGKLPRPLNDMLMYDYETNSLGPVLCGTAMPILCKHRMLSIGHKLLVVGGWDGYKRRHHCWMFDTRNLQWTLLQEIPNYDPEQAPAGLSSHTLSQVTENYFVVTGREGSVRYQKRFGSIFSLKINPERTKFEYCRMSHQIDSRSGHSASVVAKFARSSTPRPAVLIIGGRNSTTMDSIPLKTFTEPIKCPDYESDFLHKLNSTRFKSKAVNTAFRLQACLTISNWVILHGGRVFNKMRNDVIGESLYLYDSLTSRWYEIPIILSKSAEQHQVNQNKEPEQKQKPDLKRFGHMVANIKDELIILGGALNDDECTNQILKLTIS